MSLPEKLPAGELGEFVEFLGDEKLQPSPINLEQHTKLVENDPLLRQRFEVMMDACFEYTKDVAHHEKLMRTGEETMVADTQRTLTHETIIITVTAYREMLEISNPPEDIDFIPRRGQPRARFGKFALLLTLNKFKEQITLIKDLRKAGVKIDYDKLKALTQNEQELLIIEYVQMVSTIYEQEDPAAPEVAPEEKDKLHHIEEELHMDESAIFQNFMRIYESRYK